MSVQENRNSELALQLKLPAIYTDPLFAKAGGLMAYGPNRDSILKKLATYIDKIFTPSLTFARRVGESRAGRRGACGLRNRVGLRAAYCRKNRNPQARGC